MKTVLSFNKDEVLLLIKHAKSCNEHSPTYEQMFEGKYRFDGKDLDPDKDDWPKADDIDNSKIEACLHLVADQGIYLMSSGLPREIIKGDQSRIAYAEGTDPDKDENWYENKRQFMGGDDQVINIPMEWFDKLIKANKPIKLFVRTKESYVCEYGVVL